MEKLKDSISFIVIILAIILIFMKWKVFWTILKMILSSLSVV